jgi:hypothetical protein
MAMTLHQLEDLCYELAFSDDDTSAVLAALSDTELQAAYTDVLRQYGLELVCGAYENSGWMGELLMIGANEGPIKACAMAFMAVLLELERRGNDRPDAVSISRKMCQ